MFSQGYANDTHHLGTAMLAKVNVSSRLAQIRGGIPAEENRREDRDRETCLKNTHRTECELEG